MLTSYRKNNKLFKIRNEVEPKDKKVEFDMEPESAENLKRYIKDKSNYLT